jgi:hypothetical protein
MAGAGDLKKGMVDKIREKVEGAEVAVRIFEELPSALKRFTRVRMRIYDHPRAESTL